jgi:hypothetical protein
MRRDAAPMRAAGLAEWLAGVRVAEVSVALPTDRDITRPSHEPPASFAFGQLTPRREARRRFPRRFPALGGGSAKLGLELSRVNQKAFGLMVSRYPSYARPATIVGVELILDVDLPPQERQRGERRSVLYRTGRIARGTSISPSRSRCGSGSASSKRAGGTSPTTGARAPDRDHRTRAHSRLARCSLPPRPHRSWMADAG